jgi:hypothetical protein
MLEFELAPLGDKSWMTIFSVFLTRYGLWPVLECIPSHIFRRYAGPAAKKNTKSMIYVLLALLLGLVAIAALIVVCSLRSTRPRPKRASVIVLGDIGRSPRMCNHALSLANEGWSVDLIGYAESTPSQRVLQHPRIRIRIISPGWKIPKRPKILYILLAPLAAITRAFNLAAVIIGSGRKGIVLVQVIIRMVN